MHDLTNLLRESAAAKYLGVTRQRLFAIRRRLNRDAPADAPIFGVQIDGSWFYPIAHLDEYKQHGPRKHPALQGKTPAATSAPVYAA